MQVRDGMSQMVLTVGPGHTLRAVARLMSQRSVGAAVVIDPDGNGPGIITERDVLISIGSGQDPDREAVAEHLTSDVVFAAPDWSLEEAASAMVRSSLRSAAPCKIVRQRPTLPDRWRPTMTFSRTLISRKICRF